MKLKLKLYPISSAALESGTEGICLACGEEASGVEPDARRYACESCGVAAVYGAEEAILMGCPLSGEEGEEE